MSYVVQRENNILPPYFKNRDMEKQELEPMETKCFAGASTRTWRFFRSIKLALALILIISVFGLLGAFIPNVDVFHSWWFLTAGALLMLNILCCSINRWSNIKHSLGREAVIQTESFYITGNRHTEISAVPLSHAETSRIPERVLRQHGYRVRVENDGGNSYIAADKNRYFRLGTYVSHLNLVLLVLAYLLGNFLGFRDVGFIVTEGNTREVGHDTGLSLHLLSFVDEYYPDNMPKDYRSQVVLFENGQEVKQAVVRVNHPLEYKGIRIYQLFFGTAVQMQISRNGTVLYKNSVPLNNLVQREGIQRYVSVIDLPGDGLTVQLISSAVNMEDPIIPFGQMAIDVKQNGNEVGLGLMQKGQSSRYKRN